ncbi:YciI family protein [Bacteriovorax sp. PP10]|uniref:YciI family protein n=1 Tax=Bacteriovorax antarcticus TaxID=3088717 RepID=A0ABU5VQU0_9BACT|nr:YciI family protein [Bacteriovorax sp. PP10]MEA9354788.1 YciI family protein [Bacteriovorax sp. PP10]
MFIIELTYKKAMSEADKFLEAHRTFLDDQYANGTFIASGPKNPRDGGVILAREMERSELDKIIALDPFFIEGISEFKITDFAVTKRSATFNY